MTAGVFSPEQLRLLADSVDRYVTDQFDMKRHRAALDSAGCDRGAWRRIADMGWIALTMPADIGGLGGGSVELGIVMRAIGRGLVLEPFFATAVQAVGLVAAAGTQQQRDALLPAFAKGALFGAFAHQEPGTGFSADRVLTRYTEGTLTGHKTHVFQGDLADVLVVSARDAEGTLCLCLVRADPATVVRHRYTLIDGRAAADIDFAAAVAEQLRPADVAAEIERLRLRATAAVCAEAVGAMATLNAVTLDYAKIRRQFGVPIGSFQVLQHRLVDMSIAEQEANAITNAAALALDAGNPQAPVYVAAAKARVGRAARFIGEASIQIHGGIGMMDEYSAGHLFKRLLMLGAFMGDSDWHLDRLADLAPA